MSENSEFPSLMNSSLETIRHYLHSYPELSNHEGQTASYIVKWLQEANATRILTGIGGCGVVGLFSGPRVMLRAELDALPVTENGQNFVAHSCGHDGHMTILLFQPAEETGDGARTVIEDRQFKELIRPDVAYALHNQPGRRFGEISIREGEGYQSSSHRI